MTRLLRINHSAIEGRIVYLFVLVIVLQTSYAQTSNDRIVSLILYQFAYACMLFGCIIVARGNAPLQRLLALTAVVWLIAGAYFAYNPDAQLANVLAYSVLVINQAMVILVLMSYIFAATRVTRDVILAACTVYLLIGAIFVSIFGITETISWFYSAEPTHAFIDGLNDYPNGPMPWQTLVYYSYATLTTLGYGDVLPATPWARALASAEAVIGVLYLAILMARLVGLYAANEVEDDIAAT